MPNIDEEISVFIGFFREEIGHIRGMTIEGNDKNYRKLLLCSLIDSISKSIYPSQGNADKLKLVLTNHSNWPHLTHVSLTHLVRLLNLFRDPALQPLRDYALPIYDSWTDGSTMYLSEDPTFVEVESRWPKVNGGNRVFGGVKIEDLTHCSLFYKYRNNLIHQMLKAGHGIDFRGVNSPFYHSMITDPDDPGMPYDWHLVYPVEFFFEVATNIVNNVESHLRTGSIDPYSAYRFGDYWIGALN